MHNNPNSQASTSSALTARFRALAILASAVAVALVAVTAAQAEVVRHETSFVETTQFVPCANGGAGEDVAVSGNVHFRVQLTILENKASGMVFANVQGGTGVGLVSGDEYRWTGTAKDNVHQSFESNRFELTSVLNRHLVGQGGASNLVITAIFHVTVNANGDLAVTFGKATVHCK
jgi:hypothetical protein